MPAYLAAYADYQTKQAKGALVAGGSGGMLRYIPSELQQAEEFPRMLYKPAATAIDMETGIFNF